MFFKSWIKCYVGVEYFGEMIKIGQIGWKGWFLIEYVFVDVFLLLQILWQVFFIDQDDCIVVVFIDVV